MSIIGHAILSSLGANVAAKIGEKTGLTEPKYQTEIDNIAFTIKYTGENIDIIEKKIEALINETNSLINSSNLTETKLFFKKSNNNNSEKIDENFQYLYLCRSYFIHLSKATAGMKLKNTQYAFLSRFVLYFDGIDVLNEDDSENQSLFETFRDIGNDFVKPFVPVEGVFHFDDFLGDYYEKKDKHEIPDIKTSINTFIKYYNMSYGNNNKETDSAKNAQNYSTCPNCQKTIPSNSKFCPECGENLTPKKTFCGECGNRCEPGVKFCQYCGHKL